MKLISKYILILLSLLLLASCACNPCVSNQKATKATEIITPTQPIHNIKAEGNCNINVKTGMKKRQIILKGNTYSIKKASIKVSNGTLYIDCSAKSPLSIQVNTYQVYQIVLEDTGNIKLNAPHTNVTNIYSNNTKNVKLTGKWTIPTLEIRGTGNFKAKGYIKIKQLNFSGSGILMLKTLHDQKKMVINKSGPGHIVLRGYANVTTINQEGSGHTNLYWTNSQSTTINAEGSGSIKLAGKTKKLTAHLKDYTKLDAQYLRAKDIFIRTYHNAFAKIHPIDQLFAYAMDKSQINYYGTPKKLYRHPTQEGVILPISPGHK